MSVPELIDIDGIGWTRQEMSDFATGARDQHDPGTQLDHPYNRCAHCHYTRHPCDTFELASMVLALLEETA